MYIIAVGWAYVIILMAVVSSSFVKALTILVGLGVIPIFLLIYIIDAPRRRVRRASQVNGQPDSDKTLTDQ
jgi:hypothetical protein